MSQYKPSFILKQSVLLVTFPVIGHFYYLLTDLLTYLLTYQYLAIYWVLTSTLLVYSFQIIYLIKCLIFYMYMIAVYAHAIFCRYMFLWFMLCCFMWWVATCLPKTSYNSPGEVSLERLLWFNCQLEPIKWKPSKCFWLSSHFRHNTQKPLEDFHMIGPSWQIHHNLIYLNLTFTNFTQIYVPESLKCDRGASHCEWHSMLLYTAKMINSDKSTYLRGTLH